MTALAVALAAWSLLPLTGYQGVGDTATVRAAWLTWMWGTLLAALAAGLLLALTRGGAANAVFELFKRAERIPEAWWAAGSAGLLALLAMGACLFLFSLNPRNVDGFAQLFQARMFLAGKLWMTPPPELANFATLQMILGPDRWFAQYPYGQPLVLAAGLAAGAWWLMNPLFAALLAISTWRVARWCCGPSAARLALALLCLSPFVVAVAGSEMSHLPAAALGMLAGWAATTSEKNPLRGACAAGVALGLMTAFRPVDALAAAVPVGIILLLCNGRRPGPWLAFLTCGALAAAPTLWFNAATTGSWSEFGYTRLWGPEHSLGFHSTPWGTALTPGRAMALTGLDLHQLNRDLFDLPFPVLVVVALGVLTARRRLGVRDAVPLAGAAALSGILFFWFHRDVFYGPRFLFSAVPWWVVLTARAITMLGRGGSRPPQGADGTPAAHQIAVFVLAVAFGLGLLTIAPGRLGAYRSSTPVMSLHPDRDAGRAGISNAVVVIPDGWGERLIVRMWALGVPVFRSTRIYAAMDACTLERALGQAEGDAAARARLAGTLDSLASLGRTGVRAGLTPDPNLRLLPGDSLSESCLREMARDREGSLLFAPFLYLNNATLDGDVVWARDMGDGNGPLFARYRGRRFYRYAPTRAGGPPEFTPIAPAVE